MIGTGNVVRDFRGLGVLRPVAAVCCTWVLDSRGCITFRENSS